MARMSGAVAVALIVALLSPLQEAGAKQRKGGGSKPKLVVKSLKVEDQGLVPYVLMTDLPADFLSIVFKVRNKGNAVSRKRLAVLNFGGADYVLKKKVPPIDAGKTRVIRATVLVSPPTPGKYTTFLCIEDGNCTRDMIVTAIPEKWEVRYFEHGDAEAMDGMYFEFQAVQDEDSFESVFYWNAFGTVREDNNGPCGGATCTGYGEVGHFPWGAAAEPESTGYLGIATNLQQYTALIEDDAYEYYSSIDYHDGNGPSGGDYNIEELRTADSSSQCIGNGYPSMTPTDDVLFGVDPSGNNECRWLFEAVIGAR